MQARQGYRQLLRSVAHVFHKDKFALHAAKVQLRQEFSKNKNANGDKLTELLLGIVEVDEMLRFNIVQGQMNTRGNFEVALTPEHVETVAAGQSEPNGPELQNVDTSFLGKAVTIEKTKGTNNRKCC